MSLATEAEAIPRRIRGVISSEVSIVNDTVTVVFDDATISREAIKKALNEGGFPVKGFTDLAQ